MTNAYQVYTAARQLLEGYTAAMQPLCRREGLAPNGVDILLFLANNPGLDTARDVCTYRGTEAGHRLLPRGEAGAGGVSAAAARPRGPAQVPPGVHREGRACGAAGP